MDHKPKDVPVISPLLIVPDADSAITWYSNVLGAKEKFRLTDQAGKIVHAEVLIEEQLLMLAEEQGEHNTSPHKLGGTSVVLQLHVKNVNGIFRKALENGAREIFPVNDQFYGERAGRFEDPFGHMWILSTTTEELSPDEMQRRMDAM